MSEQKKPLVLIILDGWGYREDPDLQFWLQRRQT